MFRKNWLRHVEQGCKGSKVTELLPNQVPEDAFFGREPIDVGFGFMTEDKVLDPILLSDIDGEKRDDVYSYIHMLMLDTYQLPHNWLIIGAHIASIEEQLY